MRLRLGLLAPEFPPEIGGMHALAFGLATSLANGDDDVVVYAPPRDRPGAVPKFRIHPVRFDDFRQLAATLRADPCDAYLGLNAGLIPLVARLDEPLFVYLHGTDFLKPWLRAGPPWIEAVRRPYVPRLRHTVRRAALRRFAPRVAHAFTNSSNTMRLARSRLGFEVERISIVPPAVDETFFAAPLAPLRAEGEPLRLLTVTRLSRYTARKNVDGVLHALAALRHDVDVRYTVVGDGDDRERLTTLARDLGLGESVKFAGRLEADGLVAAYASSDAFIMAARADANDVEGFGIVYIEASAMGRPVVCSLEGGAIDAVEEGRNGIILRSSSVDDIAAGIRLLAEHPRKFSPEQVRSWASRFRWSSSAQLVREGIAKGMAARLLRPGTPR